MPIFGAFEADPLRELVGDWAELESFDGPGTGSRSDQPPAGFEEMARSGSERLDELGWDQCVVVCDTHAQAAGIELALRDSRVAGIAIGHATLRYAVHGDRATLNTAVHAAAAQLLETDYRSFGRAITQLTQGTLDDSWVDAYMENVPERTARFRLGQLAAGAETGSRLCGRDHDHVLLAGHRGCVMWTHESFAETAAALPQARAVVCDDVPLADPAFHRALRELCERVLRRR